VAQERGYRRVTEKVVLERYGFARVQRRVPALLIPVWDARGEVALHQARPHDPTVNNGKTIKYETPRGARLGDPAMPLWIREGVRKADVGVSKGLSFSPTRTVLEWMADERS
jgi:hypothetical protein